MTDDAPVRYVLVWFDYAPILRDSVVPIRRMIEDTISEPPERVEIDVWLESPGGDAHAAYKLALLLRHHAKHVRVVVPEYAKSAATLLALAGHEIYMAPSSELGPLDAQLLEEGSMQGSISAISIAQAADDLAQDAIELAVQGGAPMLRLMRLGRAETLDSLLRFSASFTEPLVRQLDPKKVHDAKQTLRVTQVYATDLLTPVLADHAKAGEIANHLVGGFPGHDFVISATEAKCRGLPIFPLVDYDNAEMVCIAHRLFEDTDESRISFHRMTDILSTEEEGRTSDDQATDPTDGDGGHSVESHRAPPTLRAIEEGA